MEQTTKIQTDTPEEPLIDIFYKDTYRLNSLVSQINQGALQSVTTTLDDSQGSIHSTKANVGIPKALGIPLSILSKAMFDMSQLFLTDESKATIIPLLIYRELNVD